MLHHEISYWLAGNHRGSSRINLHEIRMPEEPDAIPALDENRRLHGIGEPNFGRRAGNSYNEKGARCVAADTALERVLTRE